MKTLQNKITLRLEGRYWTATFSGPEAAKTIKLFGTATLPTSFMVGTPGAIVAEKIRELNPGWGVELS